MTMYSAVSSSIFYGVHETSFFSSSSYTAIVDTGAINLLQYVLCIRAHDYEFFFSFWKSCVRYNWSGNDQEENLFCFKDVCQTHYSTGSDKRNVKEAKRHSDWRRIICGDFLPAVPPIQQNMKFSFAFDTVHIHSHEEKRQSGHRKPVTQTLVCSARRLSKSYWNPDCYCLCSSGS